MRSATCSLLLLLAAAPAGAAEAALVLLAPTLDEDAAYALETRLRDEVTPRSPLPLRKRSETRALFDGARAAGLECLADDAACLTETGAVLGADTLVYARLGEAAPAAVLELALVDVSMARISRRVAARLPVGQGPSEATVRRLVRALLAPQRAGALEVVASPPAARVVVDGELVDYSRPVEGLEPGPRAVSVTLEGYLDRQQVVEVPAGGLARLEVTLLQRPDAPPSPGPNLALLGAGGGALAAGLVVGVGGFAVAYALAHGATRGPEAQTDPAAALDASRTYGGVAVAAAATGAVLVLGGAGALTAALLLQGE